MNALELAETYRDKMTGVEGPAAAVRTSTPVFVGATKMGTAFIPTRLLSYAQFKAPLKAYVDEGFSTQEPKVTSSDLMSGSASRPVKAEMSGGVTTPRAWRLVRESLSTGS